MIAEELQTSPVETIGAQLMESPRNSSEFSEDLPRRVSRRLSFEEVGEEGPTTLRDRASLEFDEAPFVSKKISLLVDDDIAKTETTGVAAVDPPNVAYELYLLVALFTTVVLMISSTIFFFDFGTIQRALGNLNLKELDEAGQCILCVDKNLIPHSRILTFTTFFDGRKIATPEIVIMLHSIGIVLMLLSFLALRLTVNRKAKKLQRKIVTSATYTVEVINADPAWTDADEILKNYFENWGKIVTLSVVPECPRLMCLLEERQKAIEHLLFDKSLSLDSIGPPNDLTASILDDGLRRRNRSEKISQKLGFRRDERYWREKLEEADEKTLGWLSENVYRATGRVFVMFDKEESKIRCLRDHNKSWLDLLLGKYKSVGGRRLLLRQPGEASDIQWKNLGTSRYKQFVYQILTLVCAGLLISLNGLATFAITLAKEQIRSVYARSLLIAVLAWVGNFFVLTCLTHLGKYERHHSHSGEQRNIFILVIFARIINFGTQAAISSKNLVNILETEERTNVEYLSYCTGTSLFQVIPCDTPSTPLTPPPSYGVSLACFLSPTSDQIFGSGGLAEILFIMFSTSALRYGLMPFALIIFRKVQIKLRKVYRMHVPAKEEMNISLRYVSVCELFLLCILSSVFAPVAIFVCALAIVIGREGDKLRRKGAVYLPMMDDRLTRTCTSVFLWGILAHASLYGLFTAFTFGWNTPIRKQLMNTYCVPSVDGMSAAFAAVALWMLFPLLVLGFYIGIKVLIFTLFWPCFLWLTTRRRADHAHADGRLASEMGKLDLYVDPVTSFFASMSQEGRRWDSETRPSGVDQSNFKFVQDTNIKLKQGFADLPKISATFSDFAAKVKKNIDSGLAKTQSTISFGALSTVALGSSLRYWAAHTKQKLKQRFFN